MREAGENYVLEFLRLRGDGGGDAWIGVAVEIHPPRRNRVEDAAAVPGVEPDAFGASNVQRRRIQRGICKWVPDAQRRIHR